LIKKLLFEKIRKIEGVTMMISVFLLCFIYISSSLASWTQDRFIISFWVDPTVPPANFSFEYARIASAGFTALLGGFGAVDPPTVKLQIAACDEAGLACIPASCETATGPNPSGTCIGVSNSTVFGYQMQDEPQASEFNALATWAASVKVRAPNALRFINLLPNYGFNDENVYLDYVSSFISIVKPDILCFDHYPIFNAASNSDISPAGYLRNLAIFRTASQSAGIPFWNFMNVMPYGNRSDISEGQIRWQVFSSLAFGARGILYFCYWTPDGPDFVWAQGLITPKSLPGGTIMYVPGSHFPQISRINIKLGFFGSFLLNATSNWIFNATGIDADMVPVPINDAGIISIGGSGAGSSWSLLLGAFTLPSTLATVASSSTAFILQNQDFIAPALLTISFTEGTMPFEIDPESGSQIPLLDDAPLLSGFQLSLVEGDARVIVL
jgi:hypothetical protein